MKVWLPPDVKPGKKNWGFISVSTLNARNLNLNLPLEFSHVITHARKELRWCHIQSCMIYLGLLVLHEFRFNGFKSFLSLKLTCDRSHTVTAWQNKVPPSTRMNVKRMCSVTSILCASTTFYHQQTMILLVFCFVTPTASSVFIIPRMRPNSIDLDIYESIRSNYKNETAELSQNKIDVLDQY